MIDEEVDIEAKNLGLARLEKLAEHLECGKLIHDKFDFRTIHWVGPCGSAGCAMGELPAVFPEDWGLDDEHSEVYRLPSSGFSLEETIEDYFGISGNEQLALFYPARQRLVDGLPNLPSYASRYDVADNIRMFVEMKREVQP